MTEAQRTVERLRLRAPTRSQVRYALIRLEDALRTASLPDAGARIVLVRHLALGRLPARPSTQCLAHALETRYTAVTGGLLHVAEPGAGRAEGVWFRDALEAHLLAAQAVVAGKTLAAWFWPLAIPALARAYRSESLLRVLAFSLAARVEAPRALPLWIAALVRGGHSERLIAGIEPGDGIALLRKLGIADPHSRRRRDPDDGDATTPAVRDAIDPALPERRDVDRVAVFTRQVARDDREDFVDLMLAQCSLHPTELARLAGAEQPIAASQRPPLPGASAPGYPSHPPRTAREFDAAVRNTRGSQTISAVTATAARPLDAAALDPSIAAAPASPPSHPIDSRPRSDAATARTEPRITSARVRSPRCADAHASRAGGLLYLVPLLARLGIAEWMASATGSSRHPTNDFAGRIFHLLLTRLALAADDPAWMLCAAPIDGCELEATDALRADLRDRTVRIAYPPALQRKPHACDAASRPDHAPTLAHAWLMACRRLARRRAHIGLASLVMRPARFAISATHAEVYCAIDAVDLRIRRAGLDIDPGWVPWLGRVVTFHYQDRSWT